MIFFFLKYKREKVLWAVIFFEKQVGLKSYNMLFYCYS